MKLNKIILALLLVCSFSYGNNQKVGCDELESLDAIMLEDPYTSEGKCYQLMGLVFQRINANSMLVSIADETIVYVEGIPKGTPVREGSAIFLIAKGDGAYRYTTGFGLQKVITKTIWLKKLTGNFYGIDFE